MDRGKLFLHDPFVGQIEINITDSPDLVKLQDALLEKTGQLVNNMSLGRFYDEYKKVFPNALK